MKIGILIIGSLWWRPGARGRWRAARLNEAGVIRVRTPIHYGRLSEKSQTYTMTFAPTGTTGIALIVPCRVDGNHEALGVEADELWGAEDDKPTVKHRIAKNWGSVGARFQTGAPAAEIAAWTAYFRKCGGQPLEVVDGDGGLQIAWPERVDGKPLECDVLLATTNRETPAVSPEQVAEAWIANGDGEYFFENVRTGIRTPDDERIWRRLAGATAWLDRQVSRCGPAIALLRHEYPGT